MTDTQNTLTTDDNIVPAADESLEPVDETTDQRPEKRVPVSEAILDAFASQP